MKGILIRVGIDATAGDWNAPVDPRSGDFVFVPIPENADYVKRGFSRKYSEVLPALKRFNSQLPENLQDLPMHLDPDFKYLTYGDKYPRNIPIRKSEPGDFLVFYAGLRSIWPEDRELVYALIGFYQIDEIVVASSVPREKWHENAHTRGKWIGDDEIVVRARAGYSGRLSRCIPIGEYRNRAYRVRNDILEKWGGLTVTDGYIQRSATPPEFKDPDRFLDWFRKQNVPLEQTNF